VSDEVAGMRLFTAVLGFAAVLVSMLLGLITVVQAQVVSPLSDVKATVFDETGAVIPGCEVVFKSDSGTIVLHTGMDGSVAVRLPNGRNALKTSKAGFVKSDVRFFVPIPDPLRIVLKVDNTPSDGPLVDGVPTTTSDLPSVIEGPEVPALRLGGGSIPLTSAPPSVRKIRSWQCLYLWRCSAHTPSQP
jgi:hypothetical protein